MSARRLIGAIAALVLLIPAGAFANGNGGEGRQDNPKVTGGGQVFFETEEEAPDVSGPGDTVAFTVHALGEERDNGSYEARGNFRRLERGGDNGRPTTKYFGEVTCVMFTGDDTARFGGTAEVRNEDGSRSPEKFTVDVVDNGQGNNGEDLVYFRSGDNECDEDEPEEFPRHVLARGNLKIHNNPGSD
jgi:hypothetical protein